MCGSHRATFGSHPAPQGPRPPPVRSAPHLRPHRAQRCREDASLLNAFFSMFRCLATPNQTVEQVRKEESVQRL